MSRTIELPEPNTKGSMTLEKAIAGRKSSRQFSGERLELKQIGQLCWSAQGQRTGKFRTAPSAGATYPLELYVAAADGYYHYLPAQHAVQECSTEDLRQRLCEAAWGQRFIEDAAAIFVLAAEFERTTGRYGERGRRYVYMEAGHAAQNLHLQAEAMGLGSVAIGAYDDDAVSEALALGDNLEAVYLVAVGFCRD